LYYTLSAQYFGGRTLNHHYIMKKITFLTFLLMSSMGFSQFSFDFSSTTTDNWIADQGLGSVATTTDSPAVNGAVGVVTSSSTGQDWQNAQIGSSNWRQQNGPERHKQNLNV
jgi:hypothetical protein